jgi:hypothetical protein
MVDVRTGGIGRTLPSEKQGVHANNLGCIATNNLGLGAAVARIAGCFSFWAWLRLGHSAWWLAPAIASLVLFAYLLSLFESDAAGCAGRAIDRGMMEGNGSLWSGCPVLCRNRSSGVAGKALDAF